MKRAFLLSVLILLFALSLVAGFRYPGDWGAYLAFSVAANAFLLAGFRRRALFFDTFVGVFLWLGFWLKFSIRVAFAGGGFSEPVGAFDGSPEAFDAVLWVATVSFVTLLSASFIRQRIFSYPLEEKRFGESALFLFYSRHRWRVVAVFFSAVVFVAISNVWLEIYQRGMVSGTVLPFGLNGIYKWALQFGLASGAALIVRFELELRQRLTPLALVAPIIEGFLTNTAMLSRGMVLNAAAIALGGLRTMRSRNMQVDAVRLGAATVVFLFLFICSVLLVNYLRIATFNPGDSGIRSQTSAATHSMTVPLFIDRWVGIEGLMAVSSSGLQGWDLWRAAWQERFQEGTPSLYDSRLISSPYLDPSIDRSRNHFVSLPGIVAFLYYPGSIPFLCVALVAAAWFAAVVEIVTYRYCGRNLVLCALFAQVVAFRYASFGYVPAQSYLLFGSLILNGLLILGAERALRRTYLGGAT